MKIRKLMFRMSMPCISLGSQPVTWLGFESSWSDSLVVFQLNHSCFGIYKLHTVYSYTEPYENTFPIHEATKFLVGKHSSLFLSHVCYSFSLHIFSWEFKVILIFVGGRILWAQHASAVGGRILNCRFSWNISQNEAQGQRL